MKDSLERIWTRGTRLVAARTRALVVVLLAASCSHFMSPPAADRSSGQYGTEHHAEGAAAALRHDAAGPRLSGPSGGSDRRAEAIRLHLDGVGGDDEAAEEALQLLIELHAEDPEDAGTMAYLGSARVLAAKRFIAPWKKGQTCMEGLELLDRAVALDSGDLEIRFVRAVSTHPLPAFFQRRRESEADFAWLAARCEEAVAAKTLAPEIAALTLLHHGEFRAEEDPAAARAAWSLARRLAPRSAAALAAAEKLAATDG